MNIQLHINEKKHKNRHSNACRFLVAGLCICILIFCSMTIKETFALYNTLAVTPNQKIGGIDGAKVLQINSNFNKDAWLNNGVSGLEITNISPNKLWVYFSLEGALLKVIQHINPICLNPGEKYEIPLQLGNTSPLDSSGKPNDLGLLGWRNNEQVFSGKIISRILNNYSSFEVGSITLNGMEIYKKMVSQPDDPQGQIKGIKSVNDVLLLIADRLSLIKERDELLKQRDSLIQSNKGLSNNNDQLKEKIKTLEDELNTMRSNIGSQIDINENLSKENGQLKEKVKSSEVELNSVMNKIKEPNDLKQEMPEANSSVTDKTINPSPDIQKSTTGNEINLENNSETVLKNSDSNHQ